MKLTNQQITIIDKTLVLNGVVYDDIKLELLDHIATEIEVAMDDKNVQFEDALKTAFANWKEQLRPVSSFWTGSKNVAPIIFIDKWESIHTRENRNIFRYSFISIVVIFGAMKVFNCENLSEGLTAFVRLFYLSLWISIVALRIVFWKSKKNTTFSFIFKKRSRIPLNGLGIIALGWIPNRTLDVSSDIEITSLFFIFLLLIFTISTLKIAYKHLQFTKKLSTSKL